MKQTDFAYKAVAALAGVSLSINGWLLQMKAAEIQDSLVDLHAKVNSSLVRQAVTETLVAQLVKSNDRTELRIEGLESYQTGRP